MRPFPLTLLFTLFLQSGGLLLFYAFQQQFVQVHMQAALNDPSAKFERLIISATDYGKSRINDFEICLNGKMYDVKSVKVMGAKVEMLALRDEGEENILDEIRKLICHSSDKNVPYPALLTKLSTLAYEKSNLFLSVPALVKVLPGHTDFQTQSPFSCTLPVISPPPDNYF